MMPKGGWREELSVRLERGTPPAVSGVCRAQGNWKEASGSLRRSGLDALGGAASSEELLLSKKMKIAGACALTASDSPRPNVRRAHDRLPCC